MARSGAKVLVVVAVLICAVAVAAGVLLLTAGEEPAGPGKRAAPGSKKSGPRRGKWHSLRGNKKKKLTAAQKEKMARLESLSYLAGYKRAPGKSGVTINAGQAAHPGVNLVLSGHGPEVMLMDMAGKTLHVWRVTYEAARKKFPGLQAPLKGLGPFTFRRAHLLPGGELLAIYEGFGLVKMDRDSNLLWAFPRAAHHDLFVDAAGQIVVLTRRARVVERVHPKEPTLLDYVSWLSPQGELLRELSLLETFEASDFAGLLQGMPNKWDIFHSNSIEVLDGRHAGVNPAFAAGNLLISVLYLDAIAVINPGQKKVVWGHKGSWRRQHEALLLPSGNLLLFDNQKGGTASSVLELDPGTMKPVWSYAGGKDGPFYSAECGVAHRLPNGNTLIIESLNGRAFEVNRDKKIVWEYYNPYRAGQKAQLIATLFDVVRIGADYDLSWLEE